jgi:hypothetical protein
MMGKLTWMAPSHTIFYITFATLTPLMIKDIYQKLELDAQDVKCIQQPNGHANIYLEVQKMQYLQNSFKDLSFLVPSGACGPVLHPEKFMVFCNS